MSPMAFALMILSMFFIIQNINDQIHQINAWCFHQIHRKASRSRLIFKMVLLEMLSINLHNVHDKSKSEEKCYHQEIILIPYSQKKHSWKNAQTVQTCLCCFSGLLCYFFAIGHARHPVSFRGGQTFFFMAFHSILRQILNCGFCAISSRETSVFAIFYAFQTIKRITLQPYFFCFFPQKSSELQRSLK